MVSLEKARNLNANSVHTVYSLADCYLRINEPEKALATITDGLDQLPSQYPLFQQAGHIYSTVGQTEVAAEHFGQAQILLEESFLERLRENLPIYQGGIAMLLALQEQVDDAIHYLQRSARCGLGHYADLEMRPDWDSLQSDARFKELIAMMKARSEIDQSGFV